MTTAKTAAAMAQGVRLHYGPLLYFCRRFFPGRPEKAEDVVQDVFVKVCENPDTFQGDPQAWKSLLFKIARNRCIDVMRRGAVRAAQRLQDPAHGGASQVETVERAERMGQVASALECIPQPLRQAIVLVEQEGLSYEAVAAITGLDRDAIPYRLKKARERLLAALLDSRGGEPTRQMWAEPHPFSPRGRSPRSGQRVCSICWHPHGAGPHAA